MDLKGKKSIVIGMGKTGIAAAAFLGAQGASVVAVDEKPAAEWGETCNRILASPWLSVGPYDPSVLAGADLVVPSPGISPRNAILVAAQTARIPILSEIELAYRHLRAPLIAVTGTNGKTTTTTLLGEMLSAAGKKVFVGGNIGNPLIDYANTAQTDDFVVAEISSFQLQWIETFRPRVALLLNITCDHIDYHGSFDEYRRIKARVFENQQSADWAIVNADDEAQKGLDEALSARIVRFSTRRKQTEGLWLEDDAICCRMQNDAPERYPLGLIRLPGRHNVENVMAALAAARCCGADPESIAKTVSRFRGLPHRIEFAGEKNAVRFYDDSKGTNVDAVVRALETFDRPVILLLGGRDKDSDFTALTGILEKKAKQVILFGEARDRIEPQIGRGVPSVKESTLENATRRAYRDARPGDVVLLSPGCASFDEFANYKERGNFFKDVVRSF
ncbi:MAG: UDP-N-acetylmuramoyl-L-alanine--D-glutamate ligase [Smithellaceae bacterium]|nr:UDP-N-acetylmuramoyl-L-alanine--D-glutamate ligase [Syntrophaceae bacterium]MDD4241188.1 UDP-N-acetylmuramoyl-L-alanine--D-glutamate ligase [Smithellaceae bacterium]NLX51548.1 UDP-N-acetylmuramoyl-L-alanine--D-glutamate ligase [Deltaproteobacteria bacterium]